MDGITKAFLTLFCLLLVTVTTIGLMVGAVNVSKAEHFLADAVLGIEEANLQSTAIEKWQEMAEELSYQLDCKKKDTDGDGNADLVDLTLTYDYHLPYMNATSTEHRIKAYAR